MGTLAKRTPLLSVIRDSDDRCADKNSKSLLKMLIAHLTYLYETGAFMLK